MMRAVNPANGQLIREYPEHDENEVAERLAQAEQAFASWRRFDFEERARHLTSVGDLLRENQADFARLITEEMGKPHRRGRGRGREVRLGLRLLRRARRALPGRRSRSPPTPRRASSRYEPLGPVLAIMPWNFPFWQVFRFAAPALMAGNVGAAQARLERPAAARSRSRRSSATPASRTACSRRCWSARTRRRGADRRPARSRAVTLTGSDRAGMAGGRRGRAAAQEDRARAGRLRPVHRARRRRPGRGGAAGGRGRARSTAGQSCIAAKRFIVEDAVADDFERRFVRGDGGAQGRRPAGRATREVGPLARARPAATSSTTRCGASVDAGRARCSPAASAWPGSG